QRRGRTRAPRRGWTRGVLGRAPVGPLHVAVRVRAVRINTVGVLMGPAPRNAGGPLIGPAAGPTVGQSDEKRAPQAPPQSLFGVMTLRGPKTVEDAAAFAALRVKTRVTGEGGATPSQSRG